MKATTSTPNASEMRRARAARLALSEAAVDTARVHARRPIALALACAIVLAACGESEPAPRAVIALSDANARTYQAACATCHARPGIGAPVTGVEADWRERRERGLDALLVHTVDGYRGMPPLGTCGLCSEADLRELVRYMAGLP
jgi:cytochrome c5